MWQHLLQSILIIGIKDSCSYIALNNIICILLLI